MIILPDNMEYRRREIERFLKGKNRWDSLPTHVRTAMMENLENITFISNNPENVGGTIRKAFYAEYSNVADMIKDIKPIGEWGIVNIQPTKDKIKIRNKYQWVLSRTGLRVWVMPKIVKTYNIFCLENVVNEKDFMGSMLGGKL